MPVSKEEQALDDAARSSSPYRSNSEQTSAIANQPTPTEAGASGFQSGLSFGFAPHIKAGLKTLIGQAPNYQNELAKQKQEYQNAWDTNPVAYGGGYALGAVAPTLITGGIGTVAKAGYTASKVAAAADTTNLAAQAAATEARTRALVSNGIDALGKSKLVQGGLRALGYENDKPPDATLMPKDMPAIPGKTSLDDSNTESDKPQQFSSIANYLQQAQNSNNPAVTEIAQQAQQALDQETDPEAARKLAMKLQQTPEGRAIGNEDSPTNNA